MLKDKKNYPGRPLICEQEECQFYIKEGGIGHCNRKNDDECPKTTIPGNAKVIENRIEKKGMFEVTNKNLGGF